MVDACHSLNVLEKHTKYYDRILSFKNEGADYTKGCISVRSVSAGKVRG